MLSVFLYVLVEDYFNIRVLNSFVKPFDILLKVIVPVKDTGGEGREYNEIPYLVVVFVFVFVSDYMFGLKVKDCGDFVSGKSCTCFVFG